jgi:hypothetical protein
MTSPTARTLVYLRRQVYVVAVVERWLAAVQHRLDVWGFGDVLAAHPVDRVVVLVQVTTTGNLASRLAKAKRQPELAAWLKAGGAVELHGWQCRDGRWHLRRVSLRPDDLKVDLLPRRRVKRARKGEPQGELFE